jgi:predicted XRE-type DNA-binding protein
MKPRKPRERIQIEESSGNVFADLGFPDAEERLVKATLAIEIGRIIKQRRLTQQAAARFMGIDQPKVSHLLHGHLAGYSTERLIGFLTALGRDVEIVVRKPPRSRRQGRLRVVA